MSQNQTLLKQTRSDLAGILADPANQSAAQLLSAVRRYLSRAGAGAGRSLADEVRSVLGPTPATGDQLHAQLPHRRPADVSRTLHRLVAAGDAVRTYGPTGGWAAAEPKK
jgi:hypothetical protein